jgi:hypothetical protein
MFTNNEHKTISYLGIQKKTTIKIREVGYYAKCTGWLCFLDEVRTFLKKICNQNFKICHNDSVQSFPTSFSPPFWDISTQLA